MARHACCISKVIFILCTPCTIFINNISFYLVLQSGMHTLLVSAKYEQHLHLLVFFYELTLAAPLITYVLIFVQISNTSCRLNIYCTYLCMQFIVY